MANILTEDDQKNWYKDAIIYELHIKAFFDSNGDGIGDFEGLLQKLDYLEDLGVTAIWLLPFYPSPLRDDGYDIADYYTINKSYGEIEDFKRFIERHIIITRQSHALRSVAPFYAQLMKGRLSWRLSHMCVQK